VKLYSKFKFILFFSVFYLNSVSYVYADTTSTSSSPKYPKAFKNLPYYKNLSIPLKYHKKFGVYTANIQVDENNDLIDVIVDTGSPLLIILGNSAVCPKCKPYITKSTIPNDLDISLDLKQTVMDYGSEDDKIIQKKLKINFHKYDTPIQFDSHIITNGINTSNILGISPVSKELEGISYLKNILNILHLKEQFTFLLCGNKNNQLIIGSYQPQNEHKKPLTNVKRTSLSLDTFYTINLSGIEDHNGNPLVKYYPNNYAKAILDSGTGGLIVLPNNIYDFMIKYIRDYYKENNQSDRLTHEFWHNNYCVKSNFIINDEFPDIKLSFPDYYNKHNNITITLTPNKYITEGGCGKGFRRLSFAHHNNYKSNVKHKKFLKQGEPDFFILGTPIFEQYGITFNLENKPKVKFFNKYFPCQ